MQRNLYLQLNANILWLIQFVYMMTIPLRLANQNLQILRILGGFDFLGFLPMTETEERQAVLKEIESWLGTPYHSNADIKGTNGGVDCGMILIRVFENAGLISNPIDPRPYPQQWPLHQSTEKYLEIIKTYAKELPDGQIGGPGDVVVFRLKNMKVFHHGGIVSPEWPWIIHATPPRPVMRVKVTQNAILSRLTPKFFSVWPKEP